MNKTRLMLVDDHTVVRAGLRALFDRQADLEVVAEADSAADALLLVSKERPDILILDLSLPRGGGLDLVRTLQSKGGPPKVLVLTMHDDPAYARAALSAGATGYVVKTVSEKDLLTAVRAVRRGQVFVDLDDEGRTAQVFGASRPGVGRDHAAGGELSDREGEVLRLLGCGHTNQEVADRLGLSPKTVATYKARIAEKLGLKTTADFVRFVTDHGIHVPVNGLP